MPNGYENPQGTKRRQYSYHCDPIQVEIALRETQLKHTRYEIDLSNKPEWYAPKINPASKVGDYSR